MMKNHVFVGASAVLAFALASPALAESISVPGGASVPIHVAATISSSTARAGQTFRIVATEPAVVDGTVFVAKGATGEGKVVAVSPAGKSGRQGTMSVQFLTIYAVDGKRIQLAATDRTRSGQNKTGSSNTANVAGVVLLGPVGLFTHNFVKGKDVVITPDTNFTAHVDHDVTVSTR
jgi:hypothetical protein